MTETTSHSRPHHAEHTHRLLGKQQQSHRNTRIGQRVFSAGKLAVSFTTSSPVKMHVTTAAARQAAGSTSKRGSTADHSWFVIVSLISESHVRTLSVSASTFKALRSTSGTDGSKTSSSTKSSNVVDKNTGTTEETNATGLCPADTGRGRR